MTKENNTVEYLGKTYLILRVDLFPTPESFVKAMDEAKENGLDINKELDKLINFVGYIQEAKETKAKK